MKIILKIAILATMFLIVGCMSTPKQGFSSTLHYGEEPKNLEEVTKQHFYYILKDPLSAVYELDPSAAKVYSYNPFSPENTDLANWGWLITGRLNSKNSFGAYTGWSKFYLIYRDGKVFEYEIQGDGTDGEPFTYELVW